MHICIFNNLICYKYLFFLRSNANDVNSITGLTKAKERKKHDRFNGMSEEEVVKRILPDHLCDNLDIVIVSVNFSFETCIQFLFINILYYPLFWTNMVFSLTLKYVFRIWYMTIFVALFLKVK